MFMEYVVTGGAGYIGGHLVDELVWLGSVNVIDDFSSGSYINKKVTYLKADLAKEMLRLPLTLRKWPECMMPMV